MAKTRTRSPILDPQNFLLGIAASYHCMQCQGGKKPHFRPDLGPLGANSSHGDFFFKNLVSSVTRYLGQQLSGITSEKTNDPIWTKRSDGRQTDGQTD